MSMIRPPRLIFLFAALFLLGGVVVQPLHPLYHNHAHPHHEEGAAASEILLQGDGCFIDDFKFYQQLPAEGIPDLFKSHERPTEYFISAEGVVLSDFYRTYSPRGPPAVDHHT